MARDPRTLSRMIARGDPPQTLEDVWMLIKRLAHNQAITDDRVSMALGMIRTLLEEQEHDASDTR